MAKAKALPDSTTRYWARECYRLWALRGIGKHFTNTTVQGVTITCKYHAGYVTCTYNRDGQSFEKVYKAARSWL